MSELNLSAKHGQSLAEARARLEETVRQAQGQFGALIQKVAWTADRTGVTLSGPGFTARVWVDPLEVHAVVDVPLLGRFLGTPIAANLKGLLEKTFPRPLPPS